MIKVFSRRFLTLPGYFWVIVILFAGICLLPLTSKQHLFYNLEPYPDSFTYIMPAWALAQGKGFFLIHQDNIRIPNIVSSYSLFLSVGFLVWRSVEVVLVVNVLLGVSTFFFVYCLLKELKVREFVKFLVLILLFGHASLWWVTSLALTENVAIPLTVAVTWLLLKILKATHGKMMIAFSISSALLFFSRLSLIPIVGIAWLVALFSLLKFRQWRSVVVLGLVILGCLTSFHYLQSWMKEEALGFVGTLSQTSDPTLFYSFNYVWPNTRFYLDSYLGKTQSLLWMTMSLTSGLVFGLAVVGAWLLAKKNWILVGSLLAMIVGQFSTVLLFYHHDLRYLLPTLPLLIVLVGVGLEKADQRLKRGWWWLLVVVVFSSLLWSQLSFYRLIFVQNVLGRANPWQFQAVKVFDEVFTSRSGKLITALPPYFIGLYQVSTYDVFPLSRYQEYVSKDRFVWGNRLNYTDLLAEYQQRVEQGEVLYITNAYVTHQHEVINDYENYKKHFKFELIQEGCQQACNVYQLLPR